MSMKNSLALINKLVARPGKRQKVIEILLESAKPFQSNAACVLYLVYEDNDDPNVIWVEDLWTDETEHKAELAKPGLQAYVKEAIPLLEAMPEQIHVNLVGGKGPTMSLKN
jgi:quinol monooxygenase YgiN